MEQGNTTVAKHSVKLALSSEAASRCRSPYRSFLQDLVRILHNSCKLYLAPTYPQESCKILQDLYMGIKNLAFYSKILQLEDFKNKDARFLARKR